MADFVRENCRGTGHTLAWIIENYSKHQLTKTGTPEAFHARLNALYVGSNRIKNALEQDGKWKWIEIRNSRHELIIQVVPA